MDYWEQTYKKNGALWKFEAANSAYFAANYFHENGCKNVLIPGIGYGRNTKPFLDIGFDITGIEISESAVKIAKTNYPQIKIYNGSVLNMPFDSANYESIFCYSLLHLFDRDERKTLLNSCYKQLSSDGSMIFVVVSSNAEMYGDGRKLSENRFEMQDGLNVFFYNNIAIEKEFENYGLVEYQKYDEPIKHIENCPPLRCYIVTCRK